MLKHLRILLFLLPLSASAYGQHPVISSILSDIRTDSLVYYVEEISGMRGVTVNGVTDTIYSRHRLQPGNELAYRYLMQKLASFGLQTDSFLFGSAGKNVLAIQPGTVHPERFFIICAHYDGMPTSAVAPAADDDGSGVGAVLEAARVLSHYSFEHTIIYAVWDEEEQGLLGSTAYAVNSNNQNDTLLGVLNMDAIAWDGDNDSVARIHVRPVADSEALGDTIFSINTTYNIGLDLELNNPGATYSDHASFWNNGFSAALIIQDWDNDPNPHYHTASDSITYFNLSYYEKMAKLSIASIAALAIPTGFAGLNGAAPELPAGLYPNPVSGTATLDLKNITGPVNVSIVDMNGKSLWSTSCNGGSIQIDAGKFPAGMYFVQISGAHGFRVLKMIRKS